MYYYRSISTAHSLPSLTARQTDQQGKIKDPALQSGNQKAKQLLRPTSQSCFIPSEPMFNAVLNEKTRIL